MIDSGLPLLTLNTESSYPDSFYFFSHLKNILGEIECSSQICACDLSPLRYSLTTLSLNSGGYTFLFCIRITPLNEFYHSLNFHPNPSWGEYAMDPLYRAYDFSPIEWYTFRLAHPYFWYTFTLASAHIPKNGSTNSYLFSPFCITSIFTNLSSAVFTLPALMFNSYGEISYAMFFSVAF